MGQATFPKGISTDLSPPVKTKAQERFEEVIRPIHKFFDVPYPPDESDPAPEDNR